MVLILPDMTADLFAIRYVLNLGSSVFSRGFLEAPSLDGEFEYRPKPINLYVILWSCELNELSEFETIYDLMSRDTVVLAQLEGSTIAKISPRSRLRQRLPPT